MKKEITQQQVYDLAMESFGVVPGIIKEAAERSLQVAYIYTQGNAVMESASFTAIEMNAIELKISSLNHCESCMKGHSYLLKKEGVAEADIKAIVSGGKTSSSRLNVLLQAAEYIYHAGSDEYPDYVVDFLEDSLTQKELVDIIGLISLKVISNYINNYLVSAKRMKQQPAGLR
ncbi:MAG: carboxymuconolactone decarboxylase family protein [Chitinophagales bacterium]|nr:carboxymuconolactone decarboxylase family protein [Chitinophagales bacterium]